ncbi:MAG: SDR family oxidoreductase [Vicinamibacteria bacterium]|jgi:nucleoside-diphosphate-sugar epimerase|nr:SDR family oxidoreductase [Vicinamibacteria bacterium]
MARPRRRSSRAKHVVAEEQDSSPSRYIARISTETGRELHDGIEPRELLVHAHRDNHPVEVAAQFLASRLIQLTGREVAVRRGLRLLNQAAAQVADLAGAAVGSDALARAAKRLVGVTARDHTFQFRETSHLSESEVRRRIEVLQRDARAALKARGSHPRLRVLLTGATGFLGKEILFQAATDRRIEEIVAVLRPETLRDPVSKEVVRVLSPAERGALLLKRLHLPKAQQRKFRFVGGDIEQPDLGIAPEELEKLRGTLTHVIHCAASVSFDDSYENSFRANVTGARNALAFALLLQQSPGSPFVQHIAIETSYIHGRTKASFASEEQLSFPRHFYNNYYELTKAMASIETDRFMIEHGLRVAQLLPSIVIGDSRTGNNRGDTKVVNAPINAFGRAQEALARDGQTAAERARGWAVALVAQGFPGDPSAELNLVPVDRVVAGILASLTVPEAIGIRIHLATDNRIRSQEMLRMCREELGVAVRLTDPTIYRNLTLPLVRATLEKLGEPKLANALEKLGSIFGGYSEWGQPIHKVGNDVRILGLPLRRPNSDHAFRMLCRHNRFVQEYGKVRDPDEIARRERLWDALCTELELETGHEVGAIEPGEFRALVHEKLDVVDFVRRPLRLPVRSHRGRRGARG